jgi:PilZ domain
MFSAPATWLELPSADPGARQMMLNSHMSESDAKLRRHRRRIFEATASVSFNDGAKPHPCWILDISDSGARLNVGAQSNFPDFFTLRVTSTDAVRRSCKLVWRKGNEIGVRFVQPS